MLSFNPQTGLSAQTTEQVRTQVQTAWKMALGQNLNIEPSSPAGQLIDSQTAFIATKDSELLFLANQFNPLVAEGAWQDALGAIYFLSRKMAEPTVVTCTCTGLQGTTIPLGAVVKTVEGKTLYALESAIIPLSGVVNVTFATEESGPIEIAPNTVTKIVTVIAGWDIINNPQNGVLGRNTETRAEFERRRYDSVAKNAHGTVTALYGALADLEGVIDLAVLENRTNITQTQAGVQVEGHSVYMSIYGGFEEAIAKTIYLKLGAGCGTTGSVPVTYIATDFGNAVYTYKITRPIPLDFLVQVTIRKTSLTPATIEDDIKKALLANFYGVDSASGQRVKMGEKVYASRFYTGIIQAGVQDLVGVKIGTRPSQGWTDEVFVNADKIPALEADNITVIVLE